MLLAPAAADSTWDAVRGGFGPDLERIDELLEEVSSAHRVDRYAVSGFSDGASYALALGLANGTLFDAVVAWSPGFVPTVTPQGKPALFVSHGVEDRVLPIDRTSRRIVPELRAAGYDVTYVEFPGRHWAPARIRRRSARWLAGDD